MEDRVALVTGGTGALGAAVVTDLLRAGARVAVTYRNEGEWAALERAAEHRDRLIGRQVDLTKADEAEAFVAEITARWQRLDFLVCVAGGGLPSYSTLEGSFVSLPAGQVPTAYAQSLAGVEYLNQTFGMGEIRQLLKGMPSSPDFSSLLQTELRLTYPAFEQDVASYLSKRYGP